MTKTTVRLGLAGCTALFFSSAARAKNDPQADHPDTFLHDLRAFLHLAGSVSIAMKYIFHRGQNLAFLHGRHALAVKSQPLGLAFKLVAN
ncbi:MAG: hypothetical protein NTV64_04310 [Polaromonas sp.]|nr:hypothetical protein [Polaromonas sp.]